MELIANFLKKTPIGRGILNREENDLIAQRKEWAETARRAEEEHQRVFPALIARENQARDELERITKEAEQMIEKAKKVFFRVQAERQKADALRDSKIDPAHNNLRRTASPKIGEYQRSLETRRASLSPQHEWEPRGDGRSTLVRSTAESVRDAVNRINRIIVDELPKLILEPLDDVELELRLQELDGSIPLIEMREV
jgi:hypothetical protein